MSTEIAPWNPPQGYLPNKYNYLLLIKFLKMFGVHHWGWWSKGKVSSSFCPVFRIHFFPFLSLIKWASKLHALFDHSFFFNWSKSLDVGNARIRHISVRFYPWENFTSSPYFTLTSTIQYTCVSKNSPVTWNSVSKFQGWLFNTFDYWFMINLLVLE